MSIMDNRENLAVKATNFVDPSQQECSGFLHKLKSARRFGGQSHNLNECKYHINVATNAMVSAIVA